MKTRSLQRSSSHSKSGDVAIFYSVSQHLSAARVTCHFRFKVHHPEEKMTMRKAQHLHLQPQRMASMTPMTTVERCSKDCER
mmetsp:Transcript_21286/g.35221  ORF Transcript_21286/g.35221 Transcript_21286/m.35221 type:complete len:82 (+) Transcript_21286:94-339(+)